MTVEIQQLRDLVQPVIQHGRFPESKRPIGLGLVLPIGELNAVANDSAVDHFWDIVAIAKLAVEIGYDLLWLPDHFMLKEDGEARGVWECWTMAAGIAAALSGLPLGTMGRLHFVP